MKNRSKMLFTSLLICTLLFTELHFYEIGTANQTRFDYETPNKDFLWTMADLVEDSKGLVEKTGSAYEIHANVTIMQKDTLLIGPGETLKFDKNTTLKILGNIRAVGTPGQLARLISNGTGVYKWDGLIFEGGGTIDRQKSSILDFCLIEESIYGISITNSSLTISNSIIRNNFNNALKIQSSDARIINNEFNRVEKNQSEGLIVVEGADCLIDKNTIWNSSSPGVAVNNSNAQISNNTFQELSEGIAVSGSNGLKLKANHFGKLTVGIHIKTESQVLIDGNNFEHYNGTGIVIDSNNTEISNNYFQFINTAISSISRHDLLFESNVIENVTNAIVLEKITSTKLFNNTVNYTTGACIELTASENIELKGNRIFNHFGNGLEAIDSKEISIHDNIIYFGHGISISLVDSSQVEVVRNKIYFSFNKGLSLDGTKPIAFHSNLINDSGVYDLQILTAMELVSLNNTFSYSKLYLVQNVKFTVNNYFTIFVYDRSNLPLKDVLIEIFLNEQKKYVLYTDENGMIDNILLTYREYDGGQKYSQDQIILTATYGKLEFDYSPLEIDMSKSSVFILHANYVPTIKIQSPDENTTLSGIVAINGTAFDPDNEIKNIQMQVGRGQWVSVTPVNDDWTVWYYNLDTTKFTDGLYNLNFSATDGFSTGTTSITVFFKNGEIGKTKLGISIENPLESEAVWDVIIIQGTTTAGDFRIKNVLVQVDNNRWTNATAASDLDSVSRSNPFSREEFKDWSFWSIKLNTRSITNGEHIVRAIVTDGFEVAVSEITIFVTNLPEGYTVELHADFEHPSNGDTVNGTINITGIVWGCHDKISGFKLSIDGLSVTNTYSAIGPNWWMWNYPWNTELVINGLHLIEVWARNSTVTIINEIYVTVKNEKKDQNDSAGLNLLITNPIEGSRVNGTIFIQGISYSEDTVIDVQIKIDDGDFAYTNMLDTNWVRWNYEWNTELRRNGLVTLTARIRTQNLSVNYTVWVIVDNPGKDSQLEVVITHPKNGSVINGTIFVRGIAWYSSNPIISIDVQFGTYLWERATPLRSDWSIWYFEWNTSSLSNGRYTLQCRVYDGENTVKNSIQLEILNKDHIQPPDGNGNGDKNGDDGKIDGDRESSNNELENLIMILILMNLCVMIILLIIILYMKSRSRESPKTSEPEIKDEPDFMEE